MIDHPLLFTKTFGFVFNKNILSKNKIEWIDQKKGASCLIKTHGDYRKSDQLTDCVVDCGLFELLKGYGYVVLRVLLINSYIYFNFFILLVLSSLLLKNTY